MAFLETFPQLLGLDTSAVGLLIGPVLGVDIPIALFPEATTSGHEVTSNLVVPAGAVVDRAVVRVAASAPNRTPIGGVATVRAAAGDPEAASSSMIVDFGVMRNVSGIEGPVAITRVAPWLGTSFDTVDTVDGASRTVALQELQTERLLVEFQQTVTAAAVAAEHVTTSTPPADLELLVGGVRAWFRQGPAPAGFSEEVDITAAVQTVVAGGTSPVPVVLRARVAGHLELTPVGDVQFLRTHVVAFAQGDTTVVEAAEEGPVDVPLPLPGAASTWKIHRVVATVVAEDRGPQRTLPPIGPDLLGDAELTLDPDRRLVVRLPAASLAPYTTLTGVRVWLAPGSSGIGVVGGLLGGTPAAPGVPLPGADVTEVSLDPSPGWVTLSFARPVALPAGETLWCSLAATRGRATLGLRAVPAPDPSAGSPTDDASTSDEASTSDDGIAVLRRIAPNGVARPLSAPSGLRTDALALRLVGTAPDDHPIDLVSVGLASQSAAATVDVPTSVEPSDRPDRFVRALPAPGPVPGLVLRATVTAGTRLSVGPVVVAYQEGGA